MVNPWLHRYAVVVAACSALLFITGPVVSSSEYRPLYALGQTHAWLGTAVTVLVIVLVIWLFRAKEAVWLNRLAWIALGANVAQDLLVFETGPIPVFLRIFHTLFAQFLFSTVVAIAIVTSRNGRLNPQPVANAPRLKFQVAVIAALVLTQVILGAFHRHGLTGVLPHILGALLVAVFLGPAMAAIFRAGNPELRSPAIILIMLTTLQLLLGFALLTMEAFDDIDPLLVIIATTAHVALGAFVLAAAVGIAILVRHVPSNRFD